MMLGPKQEAQGALFYEFSIEDHVPQEHLLRSIDRFVDLSSIRPHLAEPLIFLARAYQIKFGMKFRLMLTRSLTLMFCGGAAKIRQV